MSKFNRRGKYGLIIHWIGFMLGLILSSGAVLALRGFATLVFLVPLVMILFLIPNTIAWGIRRMIIGRNGFFPWQGVKQHSMPSKT
jgi:hypothetical protein